MTQGLPDQDRRRFPRLPITIQARVWWLGGELRVFTSDVSVGSVFLETREPLNVGARVRAIATVARIQASTEEGFQGMGIAFDAATVDAELIRRFVEERSDIESRRREVDRLIEKRLSR